MSDNDITCLLCSKKEQFACFNTLEGLQKHCPLEPLENIEKKYRNRHGNQCFLCGDGTSIEDCHLYETSKEEKNRLCWMRGFTSLFPVVSSSDRNKINSLLNRSKAFYINHNGNNIFVTGIYAPGFGLARELLEKINGLDTSFFRANKEGDIGGSVANIGRPSKQQKKEEARIKLAREGKIKEILPEVEKKKRGRPPKNQNDNVEKRGRGRPRKEINILPERREKNNVIDNIIFNGK